MDDTIDILTPFVSEARRARIETVLAERLAGLTVVIENLYDPHNGAAALRSVEGFGLTALHVVEQAQKFRFSSKVSQGCEKWVELHRHADFATCAQALRADGFALYAALPPGGQTVDIDQIDVTRKTALVFGNEHMGLTPEAIAMCDGSFTIPMQGMTASFNLSVSVALSVFACSRRRRALIGQRCDLDDAARARLRREWYIQSVDAAELILARVRADTVNRG